MECDYVVTLINDETVSRLVQRIVFAAGFEWVLSGYDFVQNHEGYPFYLCFSMMSHDLSWENTKRMEEEDDYIKLNNTDFIEVFSKPDPISHLQNIILNKENSL